MPGCVCGPDASTTIQLQPLYTAMQQAAQRGDRAAYEEAKEQYAYAVALKKAKLEAEKAKAQSRVNAVDDGVKQAVSEAEDRISALKASGDDDILTLEVPDSPRVDSVQQGLDDVQNLLNGVGLVPGAGEPADGLNALISLLRGDYAGMMLSAFSAIPFIGWAGTVGKAGKYALEGADVLGTVGRYADDAGEAVIKGTEKAAGNLAEGAEKAADELVEGAEDVGKYIDNTTVTLTKGEQLVVDDLVKQGKTVERIPVNPKIEGGTPDFMVDGVKTELKTLENANTNTGMKRIQNGFSQGAENVIIDARNSGLTKAQADEMIARAKGKYPNGQLPGTVAIWIDGQVITYP